MHKASGIRDHFITQFNDKTTAVISKPCPHTFINPITDLEVSTAFRRMSDGKACGPDSIPSELLKYSPDELASAVASVINSAVARGHNLSAIIGAGILVPLPKPNKAKGLVTSLRSLVLLNSVREALSLIVLKRISGDVSRHLDYVQSGFRLGRSTADVVWTQRWLASMAIRYREEFHILGLDMSKAFDTN